MISKQQIVELLKTNDKAVARALVALNERQTADEQAVESTRYNNGQGFRPCHARMGTSMAQFFLRNNYLSPKQVAYWRVKDRSGKMRIEIYAGQLVEVAKLKQPAPAPLPNPYFGADYGNMMEERMVLQERLESEPELAQRIEWIDLAVEAMKAEAYMHRIEAAGDREETIRDDQNKFIARCRMERV